MKHVKIASGLPLQGSLSERQAMDGVSGPPLFADWDQFSDPLSSSERFIQALSRAAGIAALLGGVAATLFAIARIF